MVRCFYGRAVSFVVAKHNDAWKIRAFSTDRDVQ
jgi:hypothetical protein